MIFSRLLGLGLLFLEYAPPIARDVAGLILPLVNSDFGDGRRMRDDIRDVSKGIFEDKIAALAEGKHERNLISALSE